MKLSDFYYHFIGHQLKQFSVYSSLGCCNGNTFVKSGSLVKNDQSKISRRGESKISRRGEIFKLLPFLNESIISFEIFSEH